MYNKPKSETVIVGELGIEDIGESDEQYVQAAVGV